MDILEIQFLINYFDIQLNQDFVEIGPGVVPTTNGLIAQRIVNDTR